MRFYGATGMPSWASLEYAAGQVEFSAAEGGKGFVAQILFQVLYKMVADGVFPVVDKDHLGAF